MDSVTFKHQDGDLVFAVKKGLFAVDAADRLTVSIVCKTDREHHWMNEPSFCLMRLPLKTPLKAGTSLRFRGNSEDASPDSDQEPFACVYVGVFDEVRNLRLDVKRVARDGKSMDVEIAWVQPDVQYYDGRPKQNRVMTTCTLRKGTPKQMWLPG